MPASYANLCTIELDKESMSVLRTANYSHLNGIDHFPQKSQVHAQKNEIKNILKHIHLLYQHYTACNNHKTHIKSGQPRGGGVTGGTLYRGP